MNTPCPHCSSVIEIDPATHATLTGQSHFVCPACQGSVPLPALNAQLDPAPGTHAATPASHRPQSIAAASGKTNRNFLILGATALLVLGGIAFVLASRNGGHTHIETRNISNKIINNHYFQNLIASGTTTMKDLEAIAEIRPYEDGFIGISAEPQEWRQANELAGRTGAIVLQFGDHAGSSDAKLSAWLTETFPQPTASPLWVTQGGVPAVLDGGKIRYATSSEGAMRVVLCWHKDQKPSASLSWVNPTVPLPDAEGWITLFDDGKLHGCSADAILTQGEKLRLSDQGALLLDGAILRFDVTGKNVRIRVVARKISGVTMILGCRYFEKKEYAAWFNGGGARHGNFGLGWSDPKFKDIKPTRAARNYPDFFRMEISAVDDQLTLTAEDEVLASTRATVVDHPGTINVRAVGGISIFRNIQVKILDDAVL